MKMPTPIWTMHYSRSRRSHAHLCRACRKVLNSGDKAVVARVGFARTHCLHEACAEKPAINGVTYGDLLKAHAMEYLAGCGWAEAKAFVESAPICQVGGASV